MNSTPSSCLILAALFGSAVLGFAGFPTTLPVPTKPSAVAPAPGVASGLATVYVPDLSHAYEPTKTGVMTWNNLMQSDNVPAGSLKAEFVFAFTNISGRAFAITTVHPSCGCTTAKIPPLPWVIPPGGNGEIPISVNIAGKSGIVSKTVYLATERGNQTLRLQISIQPPVARQLSDVERAEAMAIAKVDREAVFKGNCASCHAKNLPGKNGKELYDAVCGVCHDAENRATMVPNLRNLTTPANLDFWKTSITFGKPGTLMPACAVTQGGVLNDAQIEALAAYLNSAIPPKLSPIKD